MRVPTLLLVIGLGLASAPPAHATPNPAVKRRLQEIRDALERARRAVPPEIAAPHLADYVYSFDYHFRSMTNPLEQARGSYHSSLLEERELHDKVMAEQKAVERLHADGVKLQQAGAALQAVAQAHKRGAPVPETEFDGIAAGIEAVARNGDAAWASHAGRLGSFVAELRRGNAKVATAAAERAAQQAEAAKREAFQRLARETQGIADKLKQQSDAGEAVSEEALADLDKRIADIDSQHPDGAFFLRADLLALKLRRAWEKPEADAPQAVADLLGGRLDARGRTQGKKMQVKVAAETDRCYLLLASWASGGGDAEVSGFRWELPQGRQVQQLRFPGTALTEGFCAYQPEKLSAAADLAFPGTKNGLRYAVVSFAREQFPQDLLAGLVLERGDWCDPDYWEALWTRPVPGTVAYDGNQPVLLLEPGLRSSEIIQVNNPAGNHHARTSSPLTSRPPGALRFDPRELDFGSGCPANENPQPVPRAPMSLKKASCDVAVQKRYAKQWEHIEAQRAAARREGGIAPAVENRASDLENQQRREGEKCLLVDDVAEKEIKKVNDRLIDLFLEQPPADASRRAERFFRAAALRGW